MTTEALAKKLPDMRADENLDVDVATRLFGVICEEIGGRSQEIAREYRHRREGAGLFHNEDWPGSPHGAVIANGRKLARFVDPHYTVVQRWRS